jgi:hypothetical protein
MLNYQVRLLFGSSFLSSFYYTLISPFPQFRRSFFQPAHTAQDPVTASLSSYSLIGMRPLVSLVSRLMINVQIKPSILT